MCQVLAKVGPSIVPTLVGWLEDPRWFLVRNIVHILGKIGDDAAFNPVVRLLGHPHMRVRIEALRALALMAPARAARPILPLARDAEPEVRLEAVRALGALRRDEALPVLRDVAAGVAGAADLSLREEAVEALATIGTARACEALEGWLGGASGPGSGPSAASVRLPPPRWPRGRRTRIRAMSDALPPDPQAVFTYLHGMLRAAVSTCRPTPRRIGPSGCSFRP